MRVSFNIIFLLIISGFLLLGCQKEPVYPIIPNITFDSVNQIHVISSKIDDDTLKVYLSFTDGDGDLGFLETDKESNIVYYDIEKGAVEEDNGSPMQANVFLIDRRSSYEYTHSYNLPYLTPAGNVKGIKGQIEIDVNMICRTNKVNLGYEKDTVSPQMYIVDRAGNMSNIVDLPDIYIHCK